MRRTPHAIAKALGPVAQALGGAPAATTTLSLKSATDAFLESFAASAEKGTLSLPASGVTGTASVDRQIEALQTAIADLQESVKALDKDAKEVKTASAMADLILAQHHVDDAFFSTLVKALQTVREYSDDIPDLVRTSTI